MLIGPNLSLCIMFNECSQISIIDVVVFGVAMIRTYHPENDYFFHTRGKCREFSSWSGKHGLDFKSQGNVKINGCISL